MKNLVIIRHAKSSWDNPVLPDQERPLNPRGKRDAPFMGQILLSRGLTPDLIITSPAKRARKTAKLVAAAVGYPADGILEDPRLYLHGVPVLMDLVAALPDATNRVYLVGHNPDFTDLVNLLTDKDVANVPTCGVASIDFDLDAWAHVGAGLGRLALFDYPKRHRHATGPGGPHPSSD